MKIKGRSAHYVASNRVAREKTEISFRHTHIHARARARTHTHTLREAARLSSPSGRKAGRTTRMTSGLGGAGEESPPPARAWIPLIARFARAMFQSHIEETYSFMQTRAYLARASHRARNIFSRYRYVYRTGAPHPPFFNSDFYFSLPLFTPRAT